MSTTFKPAWGTAFTDAEAYLAAGKSKTDRPLSSNTRLRRVDDDTIQVVLHHTAIVTYHRDNTFTIFGGGWNTPTTKQGLRNWSPANPSSDGKGEWIVGWTGELTPARVQKCRTCKGRGRWIEADKCYGGNYWLDGRYTNKRQPCEHGQTSGHTLNTSHEESCYRCTGEGIVDYGSHRIPVTVDPSHAYTVDADGKFLGYADNPYATGNGYGVPKHKHHNAYQPYSTTPTISTSTVPLVASLIKAVPGLDSYAKHPINERLLKITTIIVTLNDTHRWTREQIADWLDTLDTDLRFSA